MQPDYDADFLRTVGAGLGVPKPKTAKPYCVRDSAGNEICYATKAEARAARAALKKGEGMPDDSAIMAIAKRYVPRSVLAALLKGQAGMDDQTRPARLRLLAGSVQTAKVSGEGVTLHLAKAEQARLSDRLLRLAKATEDGADWDDDPGKLAQAIDAVLDEAMEAFAAGESEQGMNLVVSAASTIDALLAALKVPDVEDEAEIEKAEWTTAQINDLPDSAFAWVEDGKKDANGKTLPRSNRHYPFKGADGKVDLPHLRNALARAAQEKDVPAEAMAKLNAAAKTVGIAKADTPTMQKRPVAMPYGQNGGVHVIDPGAPHPYVAHADNVGKCALCDKGLAHDNHWESVPVYKFEAPDAPTWVEKADSANYLGKVMTVALVPDQVDQQGDTVTAAEIEKAAHDWLTDSRRHGADHKVGADATPIESYIAPTDFEITGNDGQKHTVVKGSWVVVSQVKDAALFADIVAGRKGGVSIEGTGVRGEDA